MKKDTNEMSKDPESKPPAINNRPPVTNSQPQQPKSQPTPTPTVKPQPSKPTKKVIIPDEEEISYWLIVSPQLSIIQKSIINNKYYK